MKLLTNYLLIVFSVIIIVFVECTKEEDSSPEPEFESYVSFEMMDTFWNIDIKDSIYNIESYIGNSIDAGNNISDSIALSFSTLFEIDTASSSNIKRGFLLLEFNFKVHRDSIEVFPENNKLNTEDLIELFKNNQIHVNANPLNPYNNRVRFDFQRQDFGFWVMSENQRIHQNNSNFTVNKVLEITEGRFTGSIIIEGSFYCNFFGTDIDAEYGSKSYPVQNGKYKILIRNGGDGYGKDLVNY
jgi:hypothetical protein